MALMIIKDLKTVKFIHRFCRNTQIECKGMKHFHNLLSLYQFLLWWLSSSEVECISGTDIFLSQDMSTPFYCTLLCLNVWVVSTEPTLIPMPWKQESHLDFSNTNYYHNCIWASHYALMGTTYSFPLQIKTCYVSL